MQKKSLTNFAYINLLVKRIKTLRENGEDFDWYFDELSKLYNPLIQSACRRIWKRFKNKPFGEIRTRVLEILFDSVIRYDLSFLNRDTNASGFIQVYFSNYLRSKLMWDVSRIMNPVKIEYEDVIDPKHIPFSACSEEVRNKMVSENKVVSPISNHFISLCRLLQKQLKNDLYSDVMILYFGYGYKVTEIRNILDISSRRVKIIIEKLKGFWKLNKELILP